MTKVNLLSLAAIVCLVAAEYPKVGSKCKLDTDCASFEHCNEAGKCAHKALLPLSKFDIGGIAVYTVMCFVCNFSGIAGGLPLTAIISMLKFNTKTAIILSNA